MFSRHLRPNGIPFEIEIEQRPHILEVVGEALNRVSPQIENLQRPKLGYAARKPCELIPAQS